MEKQPDSWQEAPLFRFDRTDKHISIASPKIVWTAAKVLSDPSCFAILRDELCGIEDGDGFTIFFGAGSHGKLPSPK